MGVCMGKDSSAITSDLLDPDGRFISSRANGALQGSQLNNNDSSEKISPPRTPIIMVLGGPGSGKITHCDRVVQERPGLAHINMTDLIQQHVVGNGLQDFGLIPPPNLIEVLQMEMKMAVNARGYLISGYPRSMRDVVEYQNKLNRIDRVILLNWHIRILEKQIEYGSQLGDTVLQLARMELRNYSKNVLAVAEYFDQLDKLIVVDGERQPTEVYDDFLAAVDSALTEASQNPGGGHHATATSNGVGPHGKGAKGKAASLAAAAAAGGHAAKGIISASDVPIITNPHGKVGGGGRGQKVIWIIGGPGSNKSLLSSTAIRLHHSVKYEWISVGEELRKIMQGKNTLFPADQIVSIKNSIAKGELVNNEVVLKIIGDVMTKTKKKGFVIDGFPRNYQQVEMFHDRFPLIAPPPPCILVDCSEVELGRSLGQRANSRLGAHREDDQNATAVKRRLEVYRTVTLPTLKILDDQHRLHIIDGDLEDKGKIVEEFNSTIGSLIDGFDEPVLSNGQAGSKLKVMVEKRKPSTDTINKMYNEIQNSE